METQSTTGIVQNSKYFLYIAIAFVTVLLVSNTVASKIIQVGPLFLSGATFFFPVGYIFGDILTEVYGYRASRRIIWSGFAAIIFMSLMYWLLQILPAAPFWQNQAAYEVILGVVPRITVAGIIGYFLGEFVNSYVLSKMKVRSEGRNLWMRTIVSTVVGEGVDSIAFITIAFYGLMPTPALTTMIVSIYVVKVVVEVILTPVTYMIVRKLKSAEGVDVYDRGISYNPFLLKE